MENQTQFNSFQFTYSSYMTVTGIASFVILLENGLTMATIWRRSSAALDSNGNMFIFSLALSDAMYGFITLLYSCSFAMVDVNSSLVPYYIATYLVWYLIVVSAMHFALVAVDRSINVAKPFLYETRVTRKVTCVVILSTWILWLICAGVILIVAVERGEVSTPSMTLLAQSSSFFPGVAVLVLALIIVLVANIIIFRIALRQRSAIASFEISNQNGGGGHSQTSWRNAMKSVKFFVVACGVYFCTITFLVTVSVVSRYLPLTADLIVSSFFMTTVNSAVNPIIYAIMSKTFRREFAKTAMDLFKFLLPCNRNRCHLGSSGRDTR